MRWLLAGVRPVWKVRWWLWFPFISQEGRVAASSYVRPDRRVVLSFRRGISRCWCSCSRRRWLRHLRAQYRSVIVVVAIKAFYYSISSPLGDRIVAGGQMDRGVDFAGKKSSYRGGRWGMGMYFMDGWSPLWSRVAESPSRGEMDE